MPRPAILMLELDPAAEQALNEALAAAGFDVYAADQPDSLINALQATAFPLVICDADLPNTRPSAMAQRIHQTRPDTAVVFTGREASAARILDILRGGGSDLLQKPINAIAAVDRIREVLLREQQRRGGVRHLRNRAEAAENELARLERSGASKVSGLDDQLVLTFARGALQTFLDIEKQAAEQERLLRDKDPNAAPRTLHAWILHHDADFVRGMLALGQRAAIEFKPPLTSGGEILDKLSVSAPDLILLGDSLPDIPTPLVIETIKSQHPDVDMLVVEGWGTSSRSAMLVSGSHSEEIRRNLGRADDLLALVETARERSQDASFGRDFAEKFRARHREFLRRYAEVMKRLEAV